MPISLGIWVWGYPKHGDTQITVTAALGGFLVGCIELGMKRAGNEWFFKMAGGQSKYIELTEESGRNRDICRR